MEMKEVKSSNIKAVGFQNGTLRIEFHHGGTYEYQDVDEDLHRRLLAAESIGRFFHEHLRSRKGAKV